jgi:ribose 1,5-bisphosphokinase
MNRRLIYVVGPSGAGKDSVLSWLRKNLPKTAPVHWARRTIDRLPSEALDAEDHESVETAQFAQLVADDAFALHWDANAHRYGIRQSELSGLGDPKGCVLVNGSRAHLPDAASAYPGLTVLHITADRVVLRERLMRRGRESIDAIDARLKRHVELTAPSGCSWIEIRNDTTVDAAGEQLLAYLQTYDFWPTHSFK